MKTMYIEPQQSEAKYRELADLGQMLRIPIPESYLEIKITMPGGKEPIHWHKQRSHSWTRNAYNILACSLMGIRGTGGYSDGNTSLKNWAGNVISQNQIPNLSRTSFSDSDYSGDPEVNRAYIQAVGIATSGILVGIGAGAESFEDYTLSGLCTEGTGANQLHYVAMPSPTKSYDAGTKTYSCLWSRYMNNNSAGTITVTELALVAKAAHNYQDCITVMARDVLTPSVEVPASGQIYVAYTIALVYPA